MKKIIVICVIALPTLAWGQGSAGRGPASVLAPQSEIKKNNKLNKNQKAVKAYLVDIGNTNEERD